MSAITDSSTADLAFLDALLQSDLLWSRRDDEAGVIAAHILKSRAPIVVLYGPRRSGKTDLIRRRVMPIVANSRRVRLRDDPLPSSAPGDASTIEFWDSFESALPDDESNRDAVVQALSRALPGEPECRLVLVIADDALNRLFALCAAVPQIVDDVSAIPRIAAEPLFGRLAEAGHAQGVNFSDGFFAALKADLARASGDPGSELAAVLLFEICRLRPVDGEATADYYESRGRLAGILEAHLTWLLDRLPHDLNADIGWAVLEEIAAGLDTAQSDPWAEIADRFDVSTDIPAQLLRWFRDERRIVRAGATGEWDLVPPQLAPAVAAKKQQDAVADAHQRWVLRSAVLSYADAQGLPAEQTFRRIDAVRTTLKVTPDEAKLLLRCALAYEDRNLEGATRYWRRRVKDPEAQVDILLEALFDSRPEVRVRAATHLAEFPQPDVRNQLHLLALRDPVDAVRARAVRSLKAMKDPELLASLIQELDQRTSPYRLQAIDALAIYDTADACGALKRIVQTNAPGEDADARRRAIGVLGRQQSPEAVNALIDTALNDKDEDDRTLAAHVLGSLDGEDTVRSVLDRLEHLRRAAKAWNLSWSWRGVLLWLLNASLAMGVVLLNSVLHGLMLLTMRRWRLGLVLTAAGIAALLLVEFSPDEELGTAIFVVSLLIGFLLPLRIVLLERQSGTPQGWYRRCLGGVLFMVWLVPFLYFHGLPCLLTRRVARGLMLMTFEALGILLAVGAVATQSEFAAYEMVSPVFGWIWESAAIVAVALLIITFMTGVIPVWLHAFVRQGRQEVLRRIDAVEAALAPNPLVPGLILAAGTSLGARRSRRMIRKYGSDMRVGLRTYWERPDTDTWTRWRILSVLARRSDSESAEFVRSATRMLGWRARVISTWGGMAARLAVWPKPFLVFVAIVLYVQVAALVVLNEYRLNNPIRLEGIVNDDTKPPEDRTAAITQLGQLIEQRQSHEVANMAVDSLAGVVSNAQFVTGDEVVQTAALSAVAAAAPMADDQRRLVDPVAKLLNGPPLSGIRGRAVSTLKEIGTDDAATALRAFIVQTFLVDRTEDEVAIRGQAIEALAGIASTNSTDALIALTKDVTLNPGLKAKARQVIDADPLLRSELAYKDRRLDEALAQARMVLGDRSPKRVARAKQVFIDAAMDNALSALNDSRFDESKDALLSALDQNAGSEHARDLATLGLNLAFEYQEHVAPREPAGYGNAYEVLSRLQPLASEAGLQDDVRSNLAEADMTTGRHDEAVNLAKEIIATASATPETSQGLSLSMHYILYAALTLSGRTAEADAARRDLMMQYGLLPSGFTNSWQYAGTRRYIETSGLPAPQKKALLDTLGPIERPKP